MQPILVVVKCERALTGYMYESNQITKTTLTPSEQCNFNQFRTKQHLLVVKYEDFNIPTSNFGTGFQTVFRFIWLSSTAPLSGQEKH